MAKNEKTENTASKKTAKTTKKETNKPTTKTPKATGKTAKPTGKTTKTTSKATEPAKNSRGAKSTKEPRKKLIMIITIIVAAVLFCGTVIGIVIWATTRGDSDSEREDENYVYLKQELSYSESLDYILNPDQGFYRPIFVRMTSEQVTYNKNIVNNSTQLYHLRIDISAFSGAVNGSGDLDLSEAALNGLDGLLQYLKDRQKSAIVRFAYDKGYEGKANSEPSMAKLLHHIEQLSPVLNRYENVISAVEVGLFGPWGEMHTSTAANAANISAATEKFLDCTNSMPILLRTPKMIYNFLGITVNDIDGYTIDSSSKAYRLGLYNDGYLGSDSDLGTYTNREKEIKWLSAQTAHLPYGGEVVIPSSPLHDIDKCTAEMFEMNLSYLNIEWNNNVIDKWKNSKYTKSCGQESLYYNKTAFEYIQNRLGYRLVIDNSEVAYSKKSAEVKIEVDLKNVGFGNLNRKKKITVYLVDDSGAITEENLGEYSGGKIEAKFDNLDDSKNYKIYVALHGGIEDGKPTYSVRFANAEVWNENLNANYVGKIERN